MDSNMQFKELNTPLILFGIFLLVALASAIPIMYLRGNVEIRIHTKKTTDTMYIEDISLNDSSITKELTKLGCILPNVAIAQFREETGHFKSPICIQNRNIAGIRTSKSKYVSGMNLNHCTYKTYRDCLRDYVRIQEHYLRSIDGKYAEAGQYVKELRKFK